MTLNLNNKGKGPPGTLFDSQIKYSSQTPMPSYRFYLLAKGVLTNKQNK